ncbi:MAG: phosphopyruvate hydratase [Planctomycetaceae bacterium]|jgi:enolase|nr:phosphopyruvate hydratase [Planctomycetaceae bacterium]MBT6157315.1 phosphopyruvate hydratase [Planctomycetaceae bacterium]MBT6487679.1 phosphopyruvate hydratase [Planctomycetaceae bacterium]MBT6495715.1 phosphopyruvate hydratase [Planctomycetaceae bacterium]
MSRIERVHAREVLDSRGKPTVEVEVTCTGARPGRAIVPSGASTGKFEAVELRDGDDARLDGTGVLQAVANVRGEIASAIIGMDANDQQSIDHRLCELDGTDNKSRLGANATLGVSLATAYAAAESKGVQLVEHLGEIWQECRESNPNLADPLAGRGHGALGNGPLLPLPMVNMISGGRHAGDNIEFQDFLVLPVGAKSYRQALDWIVTIYRRLGELLCERGYEGVLVGDEGGFGPKLRSNEEAVELVIAAIEAAGLEPGTDAMIGLDVASTEFYADGTYQLAENGGQRLSSDGMIDLLADWVDRYPIISIEDGLAEDDWDGWKRLTERLGDRVQLIGDDLFVTNSVRLQRGIDTGTANSVLVKLNQIGTLWETLETIRLAIENGYLPVVSARSGETEDATIADLVVATGAGQIKVGSIVRSERLAKYNQLLRLEEHLNGANYIGRDVFRPLKADG